MKKNRVIPFVLFGLLAISSAQDTANPPHKSRFRRRLANPFPEGFDAGRDLHEGRDCGLA